MLEFRPHHFFCTLGFAGKGYSPSFVRNFQAIADSLRLDEEGDSVRIRVTSVTDSICAPCPSRQGILCESQEKIEALDRAHAEILGLCEGDVISWGEAKKRLSSQMSFEKHEEACAPCGWRTLGLCRSALSELKSQTILSVVFLIFTGLSTLCPVAVFSAQSRQAPVDALRAELFAKPKSPKVIKLTKALKALKEQKYSAARDFIKSVRSDELFGDDALEITAEAYSEEAKQLIEKKNLKKAEEYARNAYQLFIQAGTHHPYSPFQKKQTEHLADCEITLANALAGQGKKKAALQSFENGFQRLSIPGFALASVSPESLGNFAKICFSNSDLICSAWVRKFSSIFARTSPEIQAMAKYIPEADERSQPPHATGKQGSQTYKAPDLDLAAFDSAMMIFSQTHYRDAAKAFQTFLDEYPKSAYRFRARYWLGESQLRDKNKDEGEKILTELIKDSPLTYYGLLASIALNRPITSSIAAEIPQAKTEDDFLLPSELLRLKRAEKLLVSGAPELAAADLKELRARDALSSPFLLYLAMLDSEAANHSSAFGILGDLIQRGYSGVYSNYVLKLIFPYENMDLINRYATQYQVDPILILSLMKQESAFDTHAVSGSGALGLMQLMPATATDTEASVKRSELIESNANIRVGTKYLKKLLDRFHGNIAYSLAGYNAGPYAVLRWTKGEDKSKGSMLEFIESIPYKETREYVGSIIRNYYWYSHLITGEVPKNLDYFWLTAPTASTSPSPTPIPSAVPES